MAGQVMTDRVTLAGQLMTDRVTWSRSAYSGEYAHMHINHSEAH